MEASEYISCESCNVVGVKQSDVIQTLCTDKESSSWNSKQSLKSNADCNELSEKYTSSSAADSNVPQCGSVGCEVMSSCVTCKHDAALASQNDDALCSSCCIQDVAESVSSGEAMSSTCEKNVDASVNVADSAADVSSREHVMDAHHVDAEHATDDFKSHVDVSEQQTRCEVLQCHPTGLSETVDRLTDDVCVNRASYENALMSQLCIQSEMEDANAVSTDSCQYKELQQLCRHLQVITEVYIFHTLDNHICTISRGQSQ